LIPALNPGSRIVTTVYVVSSDRRDLVTAYMSRLQVPDLL